MCIRISRKQLLLLPPLLILMLMLLLLLGLVEGIEKKNKKEITSR
jgi:hypothetical protein